MNAVRLEVQLICLPVCNVIWIKWVVWYVMVQLVLSVLRESHRSRMIFRKVGGFVYVISVLVSMEGALADPPVPQWLAGCCFCISSTWCFTQRLLCVCVWECTFVNYMLVMMIFITSDILLSSYLPTSKINFVCASWLFVCNASSSKISQEYVDWSLC